MGQIRLASHSSSHQDLKDFNIHVDYNVNQENIQLVFHFDSPSWDSWKPNLAAAFSDLYYKNWGLWESDVFEFFFRPIGSEQYYEIQCSYDLKLFALSIQKPRELYHTPLDLEFSAKKTSEHSIELNIKNPYATTELEAGFFACLGTSGSRAFFSSNPNKDSQADFHRPELFIKL